MNYELLTWNSELLNREMHAGFYGEAGQVFIAFAPQDGKHQDFANFGMVEQLSPWIDQGRLIVVTPDSIDEESWSAKGADPGHRAYMQELWFRSITEELIPLIHEKTGNEDRVMATGCSMGGTHAANLMLRRPDLCGGVIALSGCYNSDYFFGDYMDGTLYMNSPVHYMSNLPADHPYVAMFNECPMYFCIGRGSWEGDLLPSNWDLARIFTEKGIDAMCDFWGFDVFHDWPWWKKQIVYFMKKILGNA